MGPTRPWAPLLFHQAVTLWGEIQFYKGSVCLFVSLLLLSYNCLPLFFARFSLSNQHLHGKPHDHLAAIFPLSCAFFPHISGWMSLNHLSILAAETKQRNNQASSNHKPIGI